MKQRPFLILIIILCMVSMACKVASKVAGSPTPTKAAVVIPTVEVLTENTPIPTETLEAATETSEPTSPADTNTPVANDTSTPEATIAPIATATTESKPTATPEPTKDTSGSISDTFDQENQNWMKTLIVTTQAKVLGSTFKVFKGNLVFDIIDKETYAYQFNKTEMPANVSIETTYTNQGELNNGVVLTCRAASDSSTWYEVRVSSQGPFTFYLYDRSRKQNGGKNPYVDLGGGGAVNFKSLYPDKPNTLKFTCNGEKLSIDINNGLKKFETSDKTLTGSGLVGLGAMSHEVTGVSIAFDDFKASTLP